MKLHIFTEGDEFPPLVDAWEGMFMCGDDVVCFDSPLLHNFQLGDQVQARMDDELYVYEVVEVSPASEVIPDAWCEQMKLAIAPDLLRVVNLRNVH